MTIYSPLGRITLAALLGFGVLGILVFGVDTCHKTQGTQAEHNANVASGEAHAHQTKAQRSDEMVPHLQAKLANQEVDLGRLTQERDELLKRLASKPKPHGNPTDSSVPAPNPMGDEHLTLILDLQAVVAKDAEVIASQDLLIKDQSELILVITTSRDEWKQTAEFREKQAMAQEVATKAWKQAVTSSRWLGRGEGALVGAALGLLGGRR